MADFHSGGSRLPARGVVGDVYFDAFNRKLYIAIGDGRLVALESLLAGPPIHGIDGAKGDKGETGARGPAGQDSIVPGPRGEKGDVSFIGAEELAAEVEKLRKELLAQRAKIAHALNQAAADTAAYGSSNVRGHRENVIKQIKNTLAK